MSGKLQHLRSGQITSVYLLICFLSVASFGANRPNQTQWLSCWPGLRLVAGSYARMHLQTRGAPSAPVSRPSRPAPEVTSVPSYSAPKSPGTNGYSTSTTPSTQSQTAAVEAILANAPALSALTERLKEERSALAALQHSLLTTQQTNGTLHARLKGLETTREGGQTFPA